LAAFEQCRLEDFLSAAKSSRTGLRRMASRGGDMGHRPGCSDRRNRRFRSVDLVTPFRLALVTGLAVLVAACANYETMSPGAAPFAIEEQEARLGAREHPKVLDSFGGVYSQPGLDAYLAGVLETVGQQSGSGAAGYRLTVLNSPMINAFSLPGGYLYITRGLLALANDEAELAAVLSHEIAHVDARHAIQREQQVASAAVVGQVIADMARSPEEGREALSFARQQIAQFSRQQELEADSIGIRIMGRAGYDPQAAVRFLTSLERYTALRKRSLNQNYDPERSVMATHPATPERIRAAKQNVREVTGRAGETRNAERYLQAINGLLYGDDPSEGFVRGRTYLHPRLGVTFSVPERFGLMNTPTAVVGFADDGTILRFDGIEVSRRTALSRYLERNAVRGGEVVSIEDTQIAGQPAAIGIFKTDDWYFRIALIRSAERAVYRFIMATKTYTPGDDPDFRSAVGSFRFVTAQEAQSLRPYRIEIATVQPGDTAVLLSHRMGYRDRQLERFLTLNGLQPGQTLRPGDTVKLVTE
jgi:predicted Zn-dependent protease